MCLITDKDNYWSLSYKLEGILIYYILRPTRRLSLSGMKPTLCLCRNYPVIQYDTKTEKKSSPLIINQSV